jgi:putative transposase
MQTPAAVYMPSARPYPDELPDPEYPEHFEVRRVRKSGVIFVRDPAVSLGAVLERECVGVEAIADGIWHLWFGPAYLGRLSEQR